MIFVCVIFRKSRSLRCSALASILHRPMQRPLPRPKTKQPRWHWKPPSRRGWHFPGFPNGIQEMEKTSCRFGEKSCIMDRSECDEFCNFYSKRGFGKLMFHWFNFGQAAKKEVERDLMAQIQSYAKELETTWYDVALCCFSSSNAAVSTRNVQLLDPGSDS